MAPLARPTSVGPSVAPPKPLARISAVEHPPAPLRIQRSLAAELPGDPASPISRGRVIAHAAAAPADAVAAIDTVIKQQVPHDSLLKSSTASAWEALDKVSPASGP